MSNEIRGEIHALRERLCQSKDSFCRACFEGGSFAGEQNPPNVFRNRTSQIQPHYFFVFDKPNDNNRARGKGLEPIEVLDKRDPRNSTRSNTARLVELLELTDKLDDDPLNSSRIHVTNAVKCDICAETGETGPIDIRPTQALRCRQLFFFRELQILKPKVLIFFGKNADFFVTGMIGPTWQVRREIIDGTTYTVVRVPHTTATSFNTHGAKGLAYKNRLPELWGPA